MSIDLWADDDSADFVLGETTAIVDVGVPVEHSHKAHPQPLALVGVSDDDNLSVLEKVALLRLLSKDLVNDGVINVGAPRIKAEDKRIIGGSSDVNQLIPIKYEWAWQKYNDSNANHWMPQEISMAKDIYQWKTPGELSPEERWVIESSLGYFSTADTIVVNNVVKNIYERITAPEVRQYLLNQMKEEGIHSLSYQYCIESLGMDQGRVFNLYREQPSMIIKDNWCFEFERGLANPNSTDQEFLRNLVGYYLMTEGMFFYCGFAAIFSMGRRGKLPGVCEQLQYIFRDESMHLNFGVDVINQIKIENPGLWTPQLQREIREIISEGRLIETAYAKDLMPNGLPGMNGKVMSQYLGFIANRRCNQIGVPEVSAQVSNPFPWMAEMIDIRKEKNFFETKVIDYQSAASLQW